MEALFSRTDILAPLAAGGSHGERLAAVHAVLKREVPDVDRVSVVLYDDKSRLLKSFLHSSAESTPLVRYQAPLDQAPSLQATLEAGRPRLVNDLVIFAPGRREHTRWLLAQGYSSSYTLPMHHAGRFAGFVFFDSRRRHVFSDRVLDRLDVFGHLIGQTVINDLCAVRTLLAALVTATGLVHQKDPETGNHLERMARYARLIARELSRLGRRDLADERIEQIFLFSPLHDVGKIGIPDLILRKPGRLDPGERALMATHTVKGRRIVDAIIENFGFEAFGCLDVLRHIAEGHHETLDGRGYPHGLAGDEISVEARIIAVADIFDALTSARPYKVAWRNDHAFALLRLLAIDKLDRDCVEVLLARRDEVEAIQQAFRDEQTAETA